ncbi:MAG: hypothetical protein ACKOCT_14985 [Alphaproteobacteria bacterium]
MHTIRQILQPIRKSLFLRPVSPDARRLRRMGDLRRAAFRLRDAWAPVPVPAYARTPRWQAPKAS